MLITRTPYRISFVGGGTDLKSFYAYHNGEVISSTINKYLYVVVKKQLGFVEYKYRINWSSVEFTNSIDEIKHPIVREALKYFKITYPIEITTFADVPASTGLGSSSAFAVGLVNALSALQNIYLTKYQIADIAAKIEIEILGRTIGKQDHFASTYGNFNKFVFKSDESVEVKPILYKKKVVKNLEENLILLFTGIKRNANDLLKKQSKNLKDNIEILLKMRQFTITISEILEGKKSLRLFGSILHENWNLKKKLSKNITSIKINNSYNKAIKNGAKGGKLLGAGGGGFLLFYVNKKERKKLSKSLDQMNELPFKFDNSGTRITYYDNS